MFYVHLPPRKGQYCSITVVFDCNFFYFKLLLQACYAMLRWHFFLFFVACPRNNRELIISPFCWGQAYVLHAFTTMKHCIKFKKSVHFICFIVWCILKGAALLNAFIYQTESVMSEWGLFAVCSWLCFCHLWGQGSLKMCYWLHEASQLRDLTTLQAQHVRAKHKGRSQ